MSRPGEEGGYDVNFGDPWILGKTWLFETALGLLTVMPRLSQALHFLGHAKKGGLGLKL